MKRIARVAAPVIAAVALTAALSASAFAATPKVHVPAPGTISIPGPVPAARV
jgi:hypothetical protein